MVGWVPPSNHVVQQTELYQDSIHTPHLEQKKHCVLYMRIQIKTVKNWWTTDVSSPSTPNPHRATIKIPCLFPSHHTSLQPAIYLFPVASTEGLSSLLISSFIIPHNYPSITTTASHTTVFFLSIQLPCLLLLSVVVFTCILLSRQNECSKYNPNVKLMMQWVLQLHPKIFQENFTYKIPGQK